MPARILEPTAENLRRAAEALARGEPVGMPTETVYGLAARAFDPHGVAAVFAVKERPTFDPLIVHVSPAMVARGPGALEALERAAVVSASSLGEDARAVAGRLAAEFWPGPLTLVFPRHPAIPDLVTGGLDTVAVRMPRHPVAQALIDAAGAPLAAPSANRYGRISPTTARDVVDELGDRIGFVLDGGRCEVGVESTVVALDPDGSPAILRPGGTGAEAIERVAGRRSRRPTARVHGPGAAPASPGLLESHYAPSRPMVLLPSRAVDLSPDDATAVAATLPPGGRRVALLVVSGDALAAADALRERTGLEATTISLSASGDPEEAARHLFSFLRALDSTGADVLLAEPCPWREGLGHAIADRLARAAARR